MSNINLSPYKIVWVEFTPKKGYVTKKQYTNPDGTTNWNAMALDGLKELEKLANTGTL